MARFVARFRRLERWLATEDYLYAKLVGSSLAGSFAIILLAVVFFTVTSHERNYDRLRDATLKVLRTIDKVDNDLVTIESAQRDFLLTGDRVFLEQFDHHQAALHSRLGELDMLVKNQPGQPARLARINAHLTTWENEVALPQIAAREQGADASALVARSKGKAVLSTVRAGLSDFERVTADIIEYADSDAERQRIYHTGGGAALCILAIAFLLTSSSYSFAAYRRHLAKIAAVQAETRSIIASALDAVVTVDSAGRIASINPSGEKMFGRPARDIIGDEITKLIPGGIFYYPASQAGSATHLATGARRDGSPFPIEFSLSEMLVDQRRHFAAIIRDITDRKRTEETLKQIGLGVSADTGEEFIRSLVEQLSRALLSDFAFVVELVSDAGPDGAILTLSEKGQLHSAGAFKLANTACHEVLQRGFRAYLRDAQARHPEDELLAELKIETFVAMPLVDHGGSVVGIMGVLHRDPLENAQVIESTLQIFAARAAAELERKRYEAQIAAEKDRLAATLRSIGEGFITIDQDGRIIILNSIAERLIGVAQEQAIGRPLGDIFQLLDPASRCRRDVALDRLFPTGSVAPLAGPSLLQSHNGSERLIEITAAPIGEKNHLNGAVLVFRDVTERAHAEEERRKAEKLESLGLAAGGIAHDFNNLLTSILGNVSLALYLPGGPPELNERLTSAKKATLRAQELAQQLLTFAKGGAPVKQSASIAQLLRDTVTFSLRGSAVKGEFDIPDDLWAAEIDAGQISQVVSNLTINADQAMPAGGTLRVSCANFTLSTNSLRLGLRAGRYVKIAVQDQGIGIPEENIKKIFDPYFSTKPKGSGLGLATAYSIVKSHDGVIDVVSRPAQGTTFYLFLPATDKPVRVEPEAAAPATAPFHARVLILDDEESICALVSCALRPLGYDVMETHDALSAIQAYESAIHEGRRFDVVISDLTIPGGMGGKEAVRRLHAIDPEVKAIVSSGYHTDPVMSSFREHGFCAMIAKPYELDALGRVVAEVLSNNSVKNVVAHDFDARRTA